MLGRVAVAPAGEESWRGLWPGNFGGNMDASDVREGATVYLPVFHDGALFYFGDAHALQGDGEIVGSGLETTMDVSLKFDVIKGRKIAWPRIEDADAHHGRGQRAPAGRRVPHRAGRADRVAGARIRVRKDGSLPGRVASRRHARSPTSSTRTTRSWRSSRSRRCRPRCAAPPDAYRRCAAAHSGSSRASNTA